MPSVETRSAGLSLSKDSRLVMSSLPGYRARVVTGGSATTVTLTATIAETEGVTDTTAATVAAQRALYAASTPGLMEILVCASDATKQGSSSSITAMSSVSVATIISNANFASLAAGDVVMVYPPGSVSLFLPSGHTLESSLENDYSQAINQTFDDHNTAMGVSVGGDIPLFQIPTSEGFARILTMGVGGYGQKTTVSASRTVADVVTNGTTTITSATAAFVAADVGSLVISAANVPAGTIIRSINSATSATMSAAATTSSSGLSFTFTSPPATTRSITDGATTVAVATLTSAAQAAFTGWDVGAAVINANFPSGTVIKSITSATVAVTSAAATATSTAQTVSIIRPHTLRPFAADDGFFDRMDDGSFYAQDGNGVVRRCFFGNFGTRLQLDWPEKGRGMASLSVLGNGSAREKQIASLFTYPVGANAWDRTGLACDTGPGITFRHALVEFGGTFGGAFTSAAEKFAKDLHVTVDRGSLSDNTLGDPYIIKPIEDYHRISVTGKAILQTDAIKELADGGNDDADPGSGSKGETRLHIRAALPAGHFLDIDIPRLIIPMDNIERGRGRFYQNFEGRSLATLNSVNCVDTAIPPYQMLLSNGVGKNLLLQL